MKIEINRCLEGAINSRGITIMMDVFRASNTIIQCLTSGADYIIAAGKLSDAYQLKKDHPDHLLFGERNGIPPEGFDFDNSPAKASRMDLKGKKIILTTSAGSQGIINSVNADKVIIGSFANAQAIVNYLKTKNPETISLLAIGNNAIEPATEDEECALYIRSLLLGERKDFEEVKNKILRSDGANRLTRLNQKEDLELCLKPDISQIVPVFNRKTGRIYKADLSIDQ